MGVKLTIKQELFCNVYIECGNASDAYRAAYNTENMKSETVNRKAHFLLQQDKIRARVAELQAKSLEKYEASRDKTIKRLMQGQEFDIRRLYGEDGRLKHPKDLDEDTAKSVVGVKFDGTTGVLTEYKIIDVKGCAELIGKHLRLWTDKHELSGNVEFEKIERIIVKNE